MYDNEVAAKCAQSVETSQVNAQLQMAVVVMWQIVSMHKRIVWSHTYSHNGDPHNNLVDELVAACSLLPDK